MQQMGLVYREEQRVYSPSPSRMHQCNYLGTIGLLPNPRKNHRRQQFVEATTSSLTFFYYLPLFFFSSSYLLFLCISFECFKITGFQWSPITRA